MHVHILMLTLVSLIIHAADDLEQVKIVEPTIYPIQERFDVCQLALKQGGVQIGSMQFKVYRGPETICTIDYIIVEEHERKKGNASLLLVLALKEMAEIGCKKVRTQVDSGNMASRALFEKCGFQQKEKKEHVLGSSICLQKAL